MALGTLSSLALHGFGVLKVFFVWSVSFFHLTALTNCGATLIAEDHPVPVLTQHVNCRQLQSGKEYDSPPQRNRHHDHHCCRLNPLAPTAHNRGSGSLVPRRAARLPGIPELRTRPGPSSANNSSAAAKKTRNHFPQINILLSLVGFQAIRDLAHHGFCKWNGLE